MQYISKYQSPLGMITLAADNEGIIGLWFEHNKYFGANLEPGITELETPAITAAKRWLDFYFTGKEPEYLPPIHLTGSEFRKKVSRILLQIPYGTVRTYGDIAKEIAASEEKESMSAQAVGGAVGHNPISIFVPCHRVVGANGSLTGYGGGIERKVKLLTFEGVNMSQFFVPRHGTAL